VSVPVGERRESRMEVFIQALDLVTYTLRITKNEKVFLPEYKGQVTEDIIETAKNIYIDAWEANNVRVDTNPNSELAKIKARDDWMNEESSNRGLQEIATDCWL
jgi:hypothetical protein